MIKNINPDCGAIHVGADYLQEFEKLKKSQAALLEAANTLLQREDGKDEGEGRLYCKISYFNSEEHEADYR